MVVTIRTLHWREIEVEGWEARAFESELFLWLATWSRMVSLSALNHFLLVVFVGRADSGAAVGLRLHSRTSERAGQGEAYPVVCVCPPVPVRGVVGCKIDHQT